KAHLDCDRGLKADDVQAAVGPLTLARFSIRDRAPGSPEIAALQARDDALGDRWKAADAANEKLTELETVADHLFETGDMAGARARWIEVAKAAPDHERAKPMIERCDAGIKADRLCAAKDRAGLAAHADAFWKANGGTA